MIIRWVRYNCPFHYRHNLLYVLWYILIWVATKSLLSVPGQILNPEGYLNSMSLLQQKKYQSETLKLCRYDEQRKNHESIKCVSHCNIFSMFPLSMCLNFVIPSVSWLEPWLSPVYNRKKPAAPQIFYLRISYQPLSHMAQMRLVLGFQVILSK